MNRALLGFILIGFSLIIFTCTAMAIPDPIMQGQCVELNKTYNIAGIGWYTGKIVYYGRWYDDYANMGNGTIEAEYNIPSGISKLENFYIDPVFFGRHLGYWYMDYPKYEESGNSRLFFVNTTCSPVKIEVNETGSGPVKPNATLLPIKSGGYDFLLAYGDDLRIANETPMHYWIFGKNEEFGEYDLTDSSVLVAASIVQNYNPGEYIVSVISNGENNLQEIIYNRRDDAIESIFVGAASEHVRAFPPSMVRDAMKKMVAHTIDDNLTEYRVYVGDPLLNVQTMDTYEDPTTNITYLDIRGYTNIEAGSSITATMESETPNQIRYPRITSTTNVIEYGPGQWRQFQILLPFNIDQLPAGQHFVILTSNKGAFTRIEPYIREELAPHYVPPKTIRFVDNSPFIPTPTPIIKEVVREVIHENETVKTVVVVEKVDYRVLAEKVVMELITPVVLGLCIVILALYGVYWWARAYLNRDEEND